MYTKTSPYRLLAFTFITFFVITGCQPQNASTEEPAASPIPSTVPEATSNNTASINKDLFLDPALTQDKDSLLISQYLYEGLVVLDGNGNPQPGIAESWVISDDQLDYIFSLRPGITFSDGTPITPDIVADNFNRWFDPKNPLHQNGDYAAWENIFLGFLGERDATDRAKSTVDGIQKVDSSTVLLHLNRPVSETLTYLANPSFSILNTNALALGNYGTKESDISSSGPYLVSSWNESGLLLSPNPKYWGKIPTADLKFTWR